MLTEHDCGYIGNLEEYQIKMLLKALNTMAEIDSMDEKEISFTIKKNTKNRAKHFNDNYIDACIKVKVPKWQIGQEVSVYFKDTMCIKGICEREE